MYVIIRLCTNIVCIILCARNMVVAELVCPKYHLKKTCSESETPFSPCHQGAQHLTRYYVMYSVLHRHSKNTARVLLHHYSDT